MKKVADNIRYLTGFIWKYKPSVFLYIFICGLIQALKISTGIVGIRYVLDAVSYKKPIHNVFIIIAIYVLVNMLCDFFVTHSNYYTTKTFSYIAMNMTKDVMDKSTKLDFECFDDASYYDMYTRAMSQASGAVQRLIGTYISIGSSVISIISIISLMISMISIEFVLISLINVAISYVILVIQNKWQYDFNMKMTRLNRMVGYFSGLFFNPMMAREIRVFNSSDFFIDKYVEKQTESIKETCKFQKKFFTPDYLKSIAMAITSFATMFIISLKILWGQVTIGIFMSTINAVQSLTQQLYSLTFNFPSLSNQSRYIDNLREVMEHSNIIEKEDDNQIDLNKKDNYKIEFRNVSFKYPHSNNYVIKDLSFIVNPGEHICLVGENGAGKTTIMKLLLRLYDPQEGDILIDDVSIRSYKISSLREKMSIIFQDCQVYATRIGENLFFNDVYTDEEVKKALKPVSMANKFENSKDGFNTQLTRMFDDSGIVMSGGEAQRVFLARSYIKDAGIIMLDEPSSSLDPIAENELVKTMISMLNNRTTIIVSHRLLFCKNMDRVIHIENGELIGNGTHDELICLNGKYKEMYEKQSAYYK